MSRETLLDFFRDFADVPGEFLIYDDGLRSRAFSYRESAELARAFADRLRAEGIEPDQKIILYSENRPEWIFALWGCLLAGVVAVPLDFRSSLEFVGRIAGIVGARAILRGDEVEPPRGVNVWSISSLAHAEKPVENRLAGWKPAPQTIAEIIFTSGATAEPKGVLITHRNVLANIVPVETEIRKYLRYARPFQPIRFLNLLPLSHMFGQAMATFIPPMLAGVVVFMRGYNPAEILRQIRTRRISVLVSVPKILELLRDYLVQRFPELAQSHRYRSALAAAVVALSQSASARSAGSSGLHRRRGAARARRWRPSGRRLGFLVIQGYGLTETAPIVTLNHPFHAQPEGMGASPSRAWK